MPSMNAGHTYSTFAANTDKQKTDRFKVMDDNSAASSDQLLTSWLVEND